MSSFGATDLIFNNDPNEGIFTGGFSIKNIMIKSGISPIMTINNEQHGGSDKVSDLFNSNLVVPNWAFSHNIINSQDGGKKKQNNFDSDNEDDEVIEDELYDKLLGLVKTHENELKQKFKKTKKNTRVKNGGTKKRRLK